MTPKHINKKKIEKDMIDWSPIMKINKPKHIKQKIEKIKPTMEKFPIRFKQYKNTNLVKAIKWEDRQTGWNFGIIEKINEIIDYLNKK